MTRLIALNAQKGGVGKTTAAVNLASSLERLGLRVVLVDLDPQADSTSTVGIKPHAEDGPTSFDYLLGSHAFEDVVRRTEFGSLDILPVFDAGVDRIGIDPTRSQRTGRDHMQALADGFHTRFVAEALRRHPQAPELILASLVYGSEHGRRYDRRNAVGPWAHYDYAIIDLPPQQVFPVVISLAACDAVIIPTKVEAYAMRGFARMLDTIADVREAFNPSLSILGALATFAQQRTQTTKIYLEAMRSAGESLGVRLFETVIPYRVQAIAAAGLGLPLHYYAETRRLSKLFDELAKEVVEATGEMTG